MILPSEIAGSADASLEPELVAKYAIPTPRYTSYPPATKFEAAGPALRVEEAIVADNEPGAGPLSLYFHLPFCHSACWYCGCNRIVTRRTDAAENYLADLAREVKLTSTYMDPSRPVTQVHLGGGTPNFLSTSEILDLACTIHETFDLDPDCEFGVELDPRFLESGQIEAFRAMGANRASIGVQDTDPSVQLAIHRWQPREFNVRAIRGLREAGFESINVDLIYGLPRQSIDTFSRTIEEVLELEPDRLSVFSYAHVPWLRPLQRLFEVRHGLPAADVKLKMYAAARSKLISAGFVDIGLDHFARPDDELAKALRAGTLQRNFQGYSTRAGASLYGFGLSSISSTDETYRQNLKEMEDWRGALAAGRLPVEKGYRLTEDDRRRRALIMSIMCARRVNYASLSHELGVNVAAEFAREIVGLEDLRADGLAMAFAGGFSVTERGVPFLRVIASRFDASFAPGARRHSQSV